MTVEFVAEEGVLKGLILSLEEGNTWIIGRDPDQCDLVVEDPKASRKHAALQKTDDGYLIENLSESNPVRLNDRSLLEPTLLNDGDKVFIGGTLFRFYASGAPAHLEIAESADIFEPLKHGTETIYSEEEIAAPAHIDLSETVRFVLKVISGPNTGAEFALEPEREYLIGTDAVTCDIVFYDLSVSREHARLSVSKDGHFIIQDLNSRNGVLVDRERIVDRKKITANHVVTLGTSSFLVIDRELPSQTIAAPLIELPPAEEREELFEESLEEEKVPLSSPKEVSTAPALVSRFPRFLTSGNLLFTLIVAGIIILFGIAVVSLFKTQEITIAKKDYLKELKEALNPFPGVKYTYNPTTGKLFLVGHVSTGVQKNELLYNLQGLNFIRGIDDNIVVDEAIWQEFNLLLSKQPDLQGVTMHSPYPGRFVLTGYLKTSKQAAALRDYMNLYFNYLDRLENRVIVEEQIIEETTTRLTEEGFNGVTPSLTNGELILTGYISSSATHEFQVLVNEFSQIPGIRAVRSYVVALSPEQAVVDLSERFPGRYQVTGYSKHGNVNINVVVNGRILTRGDSIDGMTITSIQPNTIFLEKDGLKYKIEYNK